MCCCHADELRCKVAPRKREACRGGETGTGHAVGSGVRRDGGIRMPRHDACGRGDRRRGHVPRTPYDASRPADLVLRDLSRIRDARSTESLPRPPLGLLAAPVRTRRITRVPLHRRALIFLPSMQRNTCYRMWAARATPPLRSVRSLRGRSGTPLYQRYAAAVAANPRHRSTVITTSNRNHTVPVHPHRLPIVQTRLASCIDEGETTLCDATAQ